MVNTLLSSLSNLLRFSCMLWYLLWIYQPKIDSKHIPVIHFLLSLFLGLFMESFSIGFHRCPIQFISLYCWHSSVYAAKNCSKPSRRITTIKIIQKYVSGRLQTKALKRQNQLVSWMFPGLEHHYFTWMFPVLEHRYFTWKSSIYTNS